MVVQSTHGLPPTRVGGSAQANLSIPVAKLKSAVLHNPSALQQPVHVVLSHGTRVVLVTGVRLLVWVRDAVVREVVCV